MSQGVGQVVIKNSYKADDHELREPDRKEEDIHRFFDSILRSCSDWLYGLCLRKFFYHSIKVTLKRDFYFCYF